ncbi:hypothetical protein SAMN05216388_101379 [Halorientalis persicus]|uniref:PIN domain-containing protein n=1 Tax=Halorientalis persicus TaxID=1367881 RepID=A0A1H8Q6X9_9EURY|nr:hypothetical protein [Halorientalis persicus]SEO49806.1 hypothetical protein SAMN05216388_101379 [Halorientalis persicus]
MSEEHPSPFPTAFILDTSFLRTVGGTETDPYQTFIQHVKSKHVDLYLTPGVVEELAEQRGYISIDWVDRADTTEWITLIDSVEPGVRVHDGPRAGEIMDRVHERLAKFEQTDPDKLRKTDSELPAAAVMLLGSTAHDSIGILIDDRNAERSISGVLDNTYYEGRIRVFSIWDAIEYMEQDTA